jgi:hypothetical protein
LALAVLCARRLIGGVRFQRLGDILWLLQCQVCRSEWFFGGVLIKKLLIILVLAACHFAASLAALFSTLSASMSRFDTGGSATASEIVIALAAVVLHFPFVLLTEALSPIRFSSSLAEYTPFVLNSLLWGTGIYYFGVWIKNKWKRQESGVGIPASET